MEVHKFCSSLKSQYDYYYLKCLSSPCKAFKFAMLTLDKLTELMNWDNFKKDKVGGNDDNDNNSNSN